MNPDVFNMEIRKFLKRVGITSQREIENAVREAIQNSTLTGSERLTVSMTLRIERLGIAHAIEDEISLE